MTGIIKRSTVNFALAIPFFNAPNWGFAFERNMDIIDAVLSTVGTVGNIVGPWEQNTVYGVDDRVVDTTDNTVWQCAVAHTSGMGTFAQDRASNPTYWDIVTTRIVVREEFQTGSDYFIGDFVFDASEYLGGIVETAFTGGANLRANIADIGIIYDLKAAISNLGTAVLHTPQTLTSAQQGQARANIGADVLAGFRNKVVNGCGTVAQNGFSGPLVNGSYLCDNWQHLRDGAGGTVTWQQVDFGQFSSSLPGNPRTFISLTCSAIGAGQTYNILRLPIEGVNTLAGRKCTVTLYSRFPSGSSPVFSLFLRQQFGTGGSPSAFVDTQIASNVSPGIQFTKTQIVFDVPSIFGKTMGTDGNDHLSLLVYLPANSPFVFEITKVSMVEGDATAEADPFSPRHIQQELALCQRYYEVGVVHFFQTAAGNDYWAQVPIAYKVKKRAPPTADQTVTYSANATSAFITDVELDSAQYRVRCTTAGANSEVIATVRFDARL